MESGISDRSAGLETNRQLSISIPDIDLEGSDVVGGVCRGGNITAHSLNLKVAPVIVHGDNDSACIAGVGEDHRAGSCFRND